MKFLEMLLFTRVYQFLVNVSEIRIFVKIASTVIVVPQANKK